MHEEYCDKGKHQYVCFVAIKCSIVSRGN